MLDKCKDKIETSNYEYIPIVLGSSVNALGVVRSLGEKGLPVIVADDEDKFAKYSKYSCPIKIKDCVEDIEGFLTSMEEIYLFLESINKKGILYITTDHHLIAIGENMDRLEKNFKVIMNDWEEVEKCLNKSFLYKEAERLGVPYPQTFLADGSKEIMDARKLIRYPILIKPAVPIGFSNVYKKAIIAQNDDQLISIKEDIDRLNLSDHKLIMQEMIPGPPTNLYTFSSYSDKNGDVKAYSIGHKIRQSPPETGTITSGKVVNHDELARIGIEFIKGLRFHGLANTEFKFDDRDGKFKLIEINPRTGFWNYSATAAGVNLSWEAYKDLILDKDEPIKFSEKELIWIYDINDIYKAIFSNKRGHGEFKISFFQWIKSVRGKKVYAIFQMKDIKPFGKLIKNLIKNKL